MLSVNRVYLYIEISILQTPLSIGCVFLLMQGAAEGGNAGQDRGAAESA